MGRRKKASRRELNDLQSAFGRHCGIRLLEVRDGYARGSMHITDTHLNRQEITHGGALFTLGDKVFGAAINYSGKNSVTMNVTIDFLRPTRKGDTLIAEAKRIKHGRTVCVYDITIRSKREKKKVAIMRSSGYIFA